MESTMMVTVLTPKFGMFEVPAKHALTMLDAANGRFAKKMDQVHDRYGITLPATLIKNITQTKGG